MIVKLPFTSVVYTVYEPDAENPTITHLCEKTLHIYDGRATAARIEREIPQNANVTSVCRHNANFEVAGDKVLAWLMENGELKD